MVFTNPFRNSSEHIVVDGGDALEAVADKRSLLQLFQLVAAVLLLTTSVVMLLLTGSSLQEKEGLMFSLFQTQEEKRLQIQTKESLQALVDRLEDIQSESAEFAQSLPLDPRYGQIISWLEKRYEVLKKLGFVELPEAISWRMLKPSEISDKALQSVGVVEYTLPFYGEYEVFVRLLDSLRSSRRLLDLTAFRNLKLDEEGLVSADLTLWAYHVSSQ